MSMTVEAWLERQLLEAEAELRKARANVGSQGAWGGRVRLFRWLQEGGPPNSFAELAEALERVRNASVVVPNAPLARRQAETLLRELTSAGLI